MDPERLKQLLANSLTPIEDRLQNSQIALQALQATKEIEIQRLKDELQAKHGNFKELFQVQVVSELIAESTGLIIPKHHIDLHPNYFHPNDSYAEETFAFQEEKGRRPVIGPFDIVFKTTLQNPAIFSISLQYNRPTVIVEMLTKDDPYTTPTFRRTITLEEFTSEESIAAIIASTSKREPRYVERSEFR